MRIKLTLNSKQQELDLNGNETLLEVIMDHLKLTGTKSSCDEAECGSCTVIINGRSALSCITMACDCDGASVETIEGLSSGDELHPIQQAFLDKGAVQCGFCTPGMIMSSKALLDNNPKPSHEEIKRSLDGNLCRCACYQKIFEAVDTAAKKMA